MTVAHIFYSFIAKCTIAFVIFMHMAITKLHFAASNCLITFN